MNFTGLLKNILLEASKFQVNYDKFVKPEVKIGGNLVPGLSPKEYIEIVKADPTTRLGNIDPENITKADFEEIKAGEYVPWLIKWFLSIKTEGGQNHPEYKKRLENNRRQFFEDLYKITDDLKKFSRFKNRLSLDKRDINKLSPGELYAAVKDFNLELATTTKKERKELDVHPGAKIVFDGPNWRVVEISDKSALGKEAACFYGGNNVETRWCTSAPGLKWFEDYIKDGNLYVIYNKNDDKVSEKSGLPIERYQFHFERDQFMDKNDDRVDLVGKLNGDLSETKDFFKPKMLKGLISVSDNSFKVRDISSGVFNIFVRLYGLGDVFNLLPDNLEHILLSNQGSANLTIEIPSTISKFQNLTSLVLNNCINELPEEVCELKDLMYLSATNNKFLRTIPDCFAFRDKMPNFEFLNVEGCPNLNIPSNITEKATQFGDSGWDFADIV
jgi:Leucine-rich repeat (LRR) protein